MPSLIAFVLDETDGDESLALAIVETLHSTTKRFTRVAFICAGKKMQRLLKKALKPANFALAFLDDFEAAKEWLVSEQY